jgi:RNA polymerase sigma-70 factor (ECF subfamily)
MDKAKVDSYIRQIAAGERDSFRKLYDYVKKPVYLFALSIIKNHQTAEDILQETMLKVALNADKYQHGTNAKAWLLSITRNLCNDMLKQPSLQDLPFEEAESFLDEGADVARSTEETEEVLAALQILTQQEREIISLYVYAGFSQVEIAKTLKIPYVKVRSQYGYAIKKLRKYYEEEVTDYESRKEYNSKIASSVPRKNS